MREAEGMREGGTESEGERDEGTDRRKEGGREERPRTEVRENGKEGN